MTAGRWRASLSALVLVLGCAYYNGLYNANRLAGDAERAEREGRAGEARSLWAQAAVKAESVATRYRSSRHWDDALLLWGKGLSRAGNCRNAAPPLALAIDSAPDAKIRTTSRFLLAECRLELRDPSGAIVAVNPLLDDPDTTRARTARLIRGQAYLRLGDATAAIADLQSVPIEAGAFDLARAYLALDDRAAAQAILEARVPGAYDETGWLAVLEEFGAEHPALGSTIVDLLLQRPDLTPGQRGRLMLADGERWLARGAADQATQRFEAVAAVAGDSLEGGEARAHLAVSAFRALSDLTQLEEVDGRLREAVRGGGRARTIATPVLNGAVIARETLSSDERFGRDLRLFLVGELFRDSLQAPIPATQIFLRLSADHPSSMITPKALLAAAMLDPSRADSIRGVLESRYPYSPYTLYLSGQAGPAFSAAEDSLKTVLALARLRGVEEQERGVTERDQGRSRRQ
jgi:hypothetical protein